ncbi:MAG: dockerin type I domain-containing protein [Alistipes senegalensis]|nr:dockerin type I domain-containing protein [Alistipes senegalensis]
MQLKYFNRVVSGLSCLSIVISSMSVALSANAAVLKDGYEDEYEAQGKTYQSLGVLEDQYDLIEPENNRFPIISPNSKYDKSYPPLFTGTYEQVEEYFRENGMTDGLPVVPPTKIKAEKFIGYSSYGYNDVVATVNGRKVKTYQIAANAIMAGCSPEHLPVCIAFVEALSDSDYLDSLKSGKLTPMMYVNGPVARQIGIDNTQGMTTEETNIAIGRFMELAVINLAGIERKNAFGNVQPLVFSENDEACINVGWKPHHVEKGYKLNDNVITATSFSMWGNNVTPATDLPEEIMKVLAWDITEKNINALGSTSVEDNANTHRLIFITEPVASALATKYKSKDSLENALVENARRPLWMRTYAYYYANTDGALTKSFDEVYAELKSTASEDAKSTASPPWLNGITYSDIDTVATMIKGNTDIIVTGDSSRNKTQVMPGGISVTKKVRLSDNWNKLVTSVNYNPIDNFYLSEQDNTITPPASVPTVLTNGTYRILDPVSGSSNLTREGRVYYDSESLTLYYYAYGASGKTSTVLNSNNDASFIAYLTNLGYNSSFTVNNGKLTDMTIRFSSNDSKLRNNTVALTSESFSGRNLTLHANNTSNSNTAGGIAKDGATIELSGTITSYTVNLDGDIVMGDTTNAKFVKLNGTKITVNPSVEAGATAIIGSENSNGTFRTMTFVNSGDGTYTITYNTANTLSNSDSTFYLKGSFNNQGNTDVFKKTDNSDIITITKELSVGKYTFNLYNLATDKSYGKNNTVITDTTNRLVLVNSGDACVLNATGGTYEFKYEISTNRLSIYYSNKTADCTGDVNADGKFNVADVVLLQKWLLAVPNVTLPDWKAADLCKDNKIDVFDMIEMRKLIVNK